MKPRRMALTPDLVARVHRIVADPGPPEGLTFHTDEDYDAAVREVLASHPPDEDAWLFAYGSLIWKPEVEHVEERIGTARGWHRSFCLRLVRWRGTKEQPGLMMALDRGGQCKGVLFRLPKETLEAQLGKLFRREMPTKSTTNLPLTNRPRWIKVETEGGSGRALTFVSDRRGFAYAGKRPLEETADILARACGHGGSCAEYLHNTVLHLEERGIRDRNLWRLQQLVADRIAADHDATSP